MGDKWGVVEVFGHQRHAGILREVERYGAKMCEIETPAWERTRRSYQWRDGAEWEREIVERHGAVTFRLGGAAIFREVECSEDEARAVLPQTVYGPDATIEVIEGEWQRTIRGELTGPVEDAEEIGAEIIEEIPF